MDRSKQGKLRLKPFARQHVVHLNHKLFAQTLSKQTKIRFKHDHLSRSLGALQFLAIKHVGLKLHN